MIADGMKRCNRCGEVKPIEAFYWRDAIHCVRMSRCKTCIIYVTIERHKTTGRRSDARPCIQCARPTQSRKTGLCVQCFRLELAEQKRVKKAKRCQPQLHACSECGEPTMHPKYCSVQCNWRAQRRIKRARKRKVADEVVELEQVASRDRWVCQLCGKRVCRQAVYHRQATLDHIIPMSRGGRHSYQNCQLTHFDCNSKKHNKVGGQQRLFG